MFWFNRCFGLTAIDVVDPLPKASIMLMLSWIYEGTVHESTSGVSSICPESWLWIAAKLSECWVFALFSVVLLQVEFLFKLCWQFAWKKWPQGAFDLYYRVLYILSLYRCVYIMALLLACVWLNHFFYVFGEYYCMCCLSTGASDFGLIWNSALSCLHWRILLHLKIFACIHSSVVFAKSVIDECNNSIYLFSGPNFSHSLHAPKTLTKSPVTEYLTTVSTTTV